MTLKGMLLTACFMLHSSLFISTATAQGLVTEIKVVAVNEYKQLNASGYSGGEEKLDLRRGRGGGYVFALFKNNPDTALYITDVRIEKRTPWGVEFDMGGALYEPVPFSQVQEHHDDAYKGGLNGRNYWCYGGSYDKQPHIYVTRKGNRDFNKKVLGKAYVTTSKPEAKDLPAGATVSGPHAGADDYFVFVWHTHEPKFKPKLNEEGEGSITKHIRYCDTDQCGLDMEEPHTFPQFYGHDHWLQLEQSDSKSTEYHYKKCEKCGQIVYEKHSWSTFSSDWKSHSKECLVCNFIAQEDHENFGKDKIPVDENYHMLYCDCGFGEKVRHSYGPERMVVSKDCEYSVVKYTCIQCSHQAYFEEAGAGHTYDDYGFCTTKGCLHPYQRPSVEPIDNGADSVFVVKTFSNLYWIADYVNNRRPKANIRLDNDLYTETALPMPWHPIGDTDSTAFKGTFDGQGHVITMLKSETPVAGSGYRGLFGAIAKGATVKNVVLASCEMNGWDNIGGVAGANEGTIEGCQVAFSVLKSIGTGMSIGGICGKNKGTISRCTTESTVWIGGVRDYAGGICGTNEGGTLSGNTTAAICGSGSDAVLPESASEQ